MPQEKKSLYNLQNNIFHVFIASLLLIILFILYSFAQNKIEKENEFRLESFKLSYELRQSSDDLTRMVRTYVVTKNPIYKEHYKEILDIRNGKKPRPLCYDTIYWDLVMNDNKRPCHTQKHSLSLLQRMKNIGFTQEEFAKLKEAKKNSDRLTKLEYTAMQLIEKKDTTQKDQEHAIQMLYNLKYHKAKKSIMQPIADFAQLVQTRTTQTVQNAQLFALILQLLLGLSILLLLFVLLHLKKIAFNILGAPLHEIHKQLSSLGKGNFDSKFRLDLPLKNSIYFLLKQTQSKLKNLQQHNQQLSNLYALLSQCNQAIVHSCSEEELFDIICKETVQFEGLELAWIALVNEQTQALDILSVAGNASEYVTSLQISIDPKERTSQGPSGQAYLQGTMQYFLDFQNSAKSSPWHTLAQKYHLKSVVGIPLKKNEKVVAVLTIYAKTTEFFNDEAKQLFQEINRDINFALDNFEKEKKQQENRDHIYKLANYDTLTNLANRSLFENYFSKILHLSQRNQQKFSLMFVDLDNFKEINDTLGHSTGDALLVEVAHRFETVLREEDVVARQGGDEFILLFPHTNANDTAQIAQKLLEIIEAPFKYKDQELRTTVSIGIALYPNDGDTLESLARNADTAMYKAKEDGRNRYHFYTQTMHETSLRHLQLSNELHSAIENNELEIYYQPQIDTKNKKLIGAEALLRWKHPKLGFISPDEFIPIAESNALIIPIGEWVLRTATAQIKQWMDQGNEPILIAVNISTLQFRLTNISEIIENILEENALAPEYLELELTERMAMKNPQDVIKTMNLLHSKGIRMSIDDFGTGYSSLSYLKQFKVYKLKIDQSFVRDITVNADDKAIVNAIINMAKGLGLKTIAEGVETMPQLTYLEEQGCDEIQGYYYSKPLPVKAFEEFRKNLNKLLV